MNVGTGFGAAALVPVGGGWTSVAGEPGHMTFGATTAEELALRSDLEPAAASVEDVLSGNGLVSLYRLLAGVGAGVGAGAGVGVGTGAESLHSEDVLAGIGHDAAARRSVEIFTAVLARVAGDLVLATGAWGGVYLFGGAALGWCDRADLAAFREAFIAKDKMATRMASVPVHAVTNGAAPLIGLARHERPGGQPLR